MIRDRTEYVELVSTPEPMPLAFSPGGFYRVVAKVSCRKCGRVHRHCVRSPRWMRGRDGEPLRDPKTGKRVALPPPDPTAHETVSAILLHATEHMVGCFDNPVTDLGFVSDRARPGRHTQKGKCGVNGHSTCVCGYKDMVHRKGCPTGMVPRTARFVTTGMSSAVQVRALKRPA